MSDYQIRLYQDTDYDTARDLFAQGTLEHVRAAFNHALTLPRVWIFMLLVFLLPLLIFNSVIVSIGFPTLAFISLWFGTRDLYGSYVKHALSDDMLDIRKYYLQRDGYCFWVAESAGEIVGTVAATPTFQPGGERHVELKRMSVAPSHRGKGIAKALCRKLIDFARERGYEAVILETTTGHLAAHNLYKEKKLTDAMANITIRRFKTRDYDIVRLLFAQGMIEHMPTTCIYVLKLPRSHFILLVSFILLLMASRSYLISFMCMTAILAAGWQLMKGEFNRYVEQCYMEDLMDIEKSYMEKKKSCFWVAESNGRVVGMVGAQVDQNSDDMVVLKRLSVAKDQRFKGIAKSLCTTVIDFAQQHGFKNVTLETSMVQYGAHKLYESMGFTKTDVHTYPTYFGRFASFSVFTYVYNIEAQ